ncbi:hypothetical protein CDAR_31071 [Caerostris darwini]|uniref:Uncharacterized protein n=1 Tax=Caerostris darwini TaxID=1538125 RepID=A0AAV4RWU8_9ARAC|nr:hypothetical protein CDAR_31071 [Caerostris darwini]
MYALRKQRAQNTVRRTKPRIRNNNSSICHFDIRLYPPTSPLSLATKRIFVVRYALRKHRAQNTVQRTKPSIRNNTSSICHFDIRLNPPTSPLSLVTKRIFVVRYQQIPHAFP